MTTMLSQGVTASLLTQELNDLQQENDQLKASLDKLDEVETKCLHHFFCQFRYL
jgi:hypothetical protein